MDGPTFCPVSSPPDAAISGIHGHLAAPYERLGPNPPR